MYNSSAYEKEKDKEVRWEINKLLIDKLPDSLSFSQKNNKVKNLLQALRNENLITVEHKKWKRKL